MIPNSPDAIEYSRAISKRLKKYLPMLKEYMGISVFGYVRIFFNNRVAYASSDDFLVEDTIKHVCDATIFYDKLLEGTQNKYFVLWPRVPNHSWMDIHVKHGYWNGAQLIVEREDCIDIFAFTSSLNNTEIKDFYIRESANLVKFSECFAYENEDVLSAIKAKNLCKFENGIDFSRLEKIKTVAEEEQMRVKKFFKKLCCDRLFNLSPQEQCCTEFLAQGRTMKEIACTLSISPRTVESYVENIKDKTGCNYKSQIIDMYYDKRLMV